MEKIKNENIKYLQVLAQQYGNASEVITEIVNLQSILALPKGTEHFLSDIHGNYEQFNHVLKNSSGYIRKKIEEIFGGTEMPATKRSLATLIYYPKEKLELVKQTEEDMEAWYTTTLHRLVLVARRVSSKYTRSRVRNSIPQGYGYIIEELITEKEEIVDKQLYYNTVISTVIRIGAADGLIEAICELIQNLSIAHLHIIGDIYDRGPGPHIILDTLMKYHSVDIQWGNHDLIWMAAASGHQASIANVVRLCTRYNNVDVLVEGYGINLTPFVTFALKNYGGMSNEILHRAITIIQLKLEALIIKANPEFGMNDRLLLDKIDYDKSSVTIDGIEYGLNTKFFPTINVTDPFSLSDEESYVIDKLTKSFINCTKLQNHVNFLYKKGNLYKIYNGNLLYHGCIPLDHNGDFLSVPVYGKSLRGKDLYDELEIWVRRGYYAKEQTEEKIKGQNIMWWLWEAPLSPLFGKNKMATFESVFIDDKKAHHEKKNPYYELTENETVVVSILKEFGLDPENAHIINGHVPQEVKKGETPIKCGGKLLIIDGGFSTTYHEKTGIAGYTLVSNSRAMQLVTHEKFESTEAAIRNETDIVSDKQTVETFTARKHVSDTESGRIISERIKLLEQLLEMYRDGFVPDSITFD